MRLARETLKARWRLDLRDFAVSLAAVESTFLYQRAIGFMSLDTGTLVWQHGRHDWHKQPAFNGFADIRESVQQTSSSSRACVTLRRQGAATDGGR